MRRDLRGDAEATAFAVGRTHGDGLKPLFATLKVLHDGKALESMGFTVLRADLLEADLAEGLRIEEQEAASECGRLVVSLMKQSVRTEMQYLLGLPHRLAQFISADEAAKQQVLDLVKLDYESFCFVATSQYGGSKDYGKRVRRSPFMMPVLRSFVAKALRSNWEPTPAMQTQIEDLYGGLHNSAICEDAAQKIRQEESANGSLSLTRCWSIPVSFGLLAQHKQAELSKGSQEIMPGDPADPPVNLFRAKRRECSIPEVSDIASRKEPSWAHFAPGTMICGVTDLLLFRQVKSTGSFDIITSMWRSGVFQQGLLVRHVDEPDFRLSLGRLHTSEIVPCWPTRQIVCDDCVLFAISELSPADRIIWFIATSFSDFVVQPVEWIGPEESRLHTDMRGIYIYIYELQWCRTSYLGFLLRASIL